MISLDVQPYCGNCPDFVPDVDGPTKIYADNIMLQSNTIVRCKYRKRCEAMIRYLEKRKAEN